MSPGREVPERIEAFVDAYRRAFESFDLDEIVRHFAFPCHVTTEAPRVSVDAFRDEASWRSRLEGLLGFYRSAGVASARPLEVSATELSPRVALVAVHWRLEDASGRRVYDFHAHYTVVDVDGEPRIVAIAHDELPRIQAVAASARE